jgi:Ni/Co efflux regulator RcnB
MEGKMKPQMKPQMKQRCMMAVLATFLSLGAFSAFAQDRDRREHDKFDDNDRRVAHEWYEAHHNRPPAGFRERDRLEAKHEELLREGYVLDQGFRGRIQPLPSGLRLPPPPRQQRYVVIGGHVVLIDRGYRVHDVIHLELR